MLAEIIVILLVVIQFTKEQKELRLHSDNPPHLPKRILYAVLDWGLGHAVHSVPMIRSLSENNEVILAATGRALAFLKDEFPHLESINLPDYTIQYASKQQFLVVRLILQVPAILASLLREHYLTEKVVRVRDIDLIISDNRYGVYSGKVPSFFVTHQLRFKLPRKIRKFEVISEWFNLWYFRKYSGVLVLDEAGKENLAGDLAHSGKICRHPKLTYIGLWSTVHEETVPRDIDALAVISGPEPHREIFGKKVIEQMKNMSGNKVVVLGKPEDTGKDYSYPGLQVYSFKNRKEANDLLNRAKIVVCRSGYSSTMDLISLKKPALMVPTPGQTEQEYQAEYYKNKGYFYSVPQDKMNLSVDLQRAENFCRIGKSHFKVNQFDLFYKALGEQLPEKDHEQNI
jgi:UDP:flavonoid glycosyltransferase YjiC (YdhE family)